MADAIAFWIILIITCIGALKELGQKVEEKLAQIAVINTEVDEELRVMAEGEVDEDWKAELQQAVISMMLAYLLNYLDTFNRMMAELAAEEESLSKLMLTASQKLHDLVNAMAWFLIA